MIKMVKLVITVTSILFAGMILYVALTWFGIVPVMTTTHHGTPIAFHGFGMIFVWALVILIIYGLLYQTFNPIESQRSYKASLETLKERYARGEIDAETYKKMRKTLED